MRRLSLLVAAMVSFGAGQIAYAADMPTKAPISTAVNWAGWYVGVAGGAGWGNSEQTDATPFTSGRYGTKGGIVGVTAGYNWQSGAIVLGAETDLSFANINGSTIGTDPASGNCIATNCESEIRALGTLRGRLGVAWKNLLPYVTGGLAYADVYGREGNGGALGGSGSKWMAGWTLGAGLEAQFTPHWTGKVEYLYVDLGNKDVFTDTLFLGVPFAENLRVTAQVVRVGLNYRF